MFAELDVILVAIMLIWGFIALLRGLTRELLIALSWITAAVATFLLWPYLPLVQHYIQPDVLALAAMSVIALAGVIAMLSGRTSDVLTVISWAVLPLTAIALFPSYRQNSAVCLFAAVLIVSNAIIVTLSKKNLANGTGATGRLLGFVFGAMRGFILVAFAYQLAALVQPAEGMPAWVRQARTLPLIEKTGGTLVSWLPAAPPSRLGSAPK